MAEETTLDPFSNATYVAAQVVTPHFNQFGTDSYIFFNLDKTSFAEDALFDTIPEVLPELNKENQRIYPAQNAVLPA